MADPYQGLAADYDWIFDDDALAGGAAINHPATARLLQQIGPGGDVLDAACGTGIDADDRCCRRLSGSRRTLRAVARDGGPVTAVGR